VYRVAGVTVGVAIKILLGRNPNSRANHSLVAGIIEPTASDCRANQMIVLKDVAVEYNRIGKSGSALILTVAKTDESHVAIVAFENEFSDTSIDPRPHLYKQAQIDIFDRSIPVRDEESDDDAKMAEAPDDLVNLLKS